MLALNGNLKGSKLDFKKILESENKTNALVNPFGATTDLFKKLQKNVFN